MTSYFDPVFSAGPPVGHAESKDGAATVAPRVEVDLDSRGVHVHVIFWFRWLGSWTKTEELLTECIQR